MVAKGQTNLKAVVNVGGVQLDAVKSLKPGYNALKFSGDSFKKGGKVQLEVWDGSTMVGGGYGAISVSVCLLITLWTVLTRYRCLPLLPARLATTTSR